MGRRKTALFKVMCVLGRLIYKGGNGMRWRRTNANIKIICLIMMCNSIVLGVSLSSLAEFPERYQMEKGNVKFDCEVICPEYLEKGIYSVKQVEAAWADKACQEELLVNGKDIREKHESDASEFAPASTYYILENGTHVSAGGNFSYSIPTANFYWQLGLISNYEGKYQNIVLEMGEPEEYIQNTKGLLKQIGIPADRYQFQWMSFDSEMLEQLEKKHIAANLIDAGDEKGIWTNEDEIYIVYGWQYEQELPVLTEIMGFDFESCLDRVENASVISIYSARGMEYILALKYYQFQETGKELQLVEFETAAQTVEEKLNSILGENQYEVVQAKLFERVKRTEKQELEAKPVWRFDVVENDNSHFAVLVDAGTGEESYFL